MTFRELREDPHDYLSNFLLNTTHHFFSDSRGFAFAYLFIHAVINSVLVVSLLKKRYWAYPAAIFFFLMFVVYQLIRFTHTRSPVLIGLSLFDLVVTWLVWKEYQALKRHLARASESD